MRRKWFLIAPFAVLGIVAFMIIGVELVMHLWNWLTPDLFGWRQINFRQALALLVLCRLLFGGFGARGGLRSGIRRKMADRWDGRMAERWERMTPEDREKFRQNARGRCGPFEPPTSAATPTS